ncbi:MAG: D-glycero-beta-D-manno-heptose 1-phosphate adenylyltransferase [Bacteroidota bacterium]
MSKFDIIQSKIFSNKESLEFNQKLAFWNFKNKKIVFTNGCFDVLHVGHIKYLAKAADLGSILIVGVNTDNSVKRLKGESRPINNQDARSTVLAALSFVDAIVFFEEDTPYNLIKLVQPDILVKGSDYKPEDIVGYDIVKNKGGDIITIDFVEGYSSSNIISKM